ncbi:MAG: DUF1844 domain-containing protein [Acidobacteria bacterium]|nr:DUF1844 domain-containing protein [Acidobacteriota bacterium]
MSEEKPTFKITDRRLFNPDGSPRDIEPEETPAAAAPEASKESEASAPAAAHTSGGGADSQAASAGPESSARPPADGSGGAAAAAAGTPAEEDDPQEFLMVVEFIASFAADALGMVNHPGAEGRDINPPLAKQCIDMLGTLQRKTRGNLNEEEQQFFELVLSQLRMQYVSVTRGAGVASPRGGGGGRGFTGGDITGGR